MSANPHPWTSSWPSADSWPSDASSDVSSDVVFGDKIGHVVFGEGPSYDVFDILFVVHDSLVVLLDEV